IWIQAYRGWRGAKVSPNKQSEPTPDGFLLRVDLPQTRTIPVRPFHPRCDELIFVTSTPQERDPCAGTATQGPASRSCRARRSPATQSHIAAHLPEGHGSAPLSSLFPLERLRIHHVDRLARGPRQQPLDSAGVDALVPFPFRVAEVGRTQCIGHREQR